MGGTGRGGESLPLVGLAIYPLTINKHLNNIVALSALNSSHELTIE